MARSPVQVATTSTPARAACRDAVAVIVAYVPFGVALGATLASGGVHPLVAWSSSPVLFGGAAQLLTVQLLGAGASAGVVIAAALIVNARMLLYSASRQWRSRWRWVGAYLLADPVYALAIGRFRRAGGGEPGDRLVYYMAVGLTLWVGWQLITAAGMVLAGVLPTSLHLELAAPLTFLLLLLPMLTGRAACAAAAVGAAVAVAASGLPLGLGVLAGATAGMATGALVAARYA